MAVTPPHSGVQPPLPPGHDERQVELLHAGRLRGGDQAERRVQAGVDVRGEAGRPARRRDPADGLGRGTGRGGWRGGGTPARGWWSRRPARGWPGRSARRGKCCRARTTRVRDSPSCPGTVSPLMVQSAGWPGRAGRARHEADGDRFRPAGWWRPSCRSSPSPGRRRRCTSRPRARTRAVPAGSVKASVQPVTAAVPGLVIVYWPV